MRHLMVDGKYLDAILSGRKTLTIRLNKPKLEPGDLAYIHSKGKIRGIIRVKRVYSKRFEELTEEEAMKDGFETLEELKEALQEHYGDLKGKRLWIIEFELVERMEKEESYGDPVEIAKEALEKLELKDGERRILEAIVRTGSIRKTAELLYGDPLRRKRIRSVLRRVMRKLRAQENLGKRGRDREHGKREALKKPH